MSQIKITNTISCRLTRLPARFAQLATLAFCCWMLIVLILGARMAYQSISEVVATLISTQSMDLGNVSVVPGGLDSVLMFASAALAVYSVVFLSVILARLVRPAVTAFVAFLVSAVIFLLAAIASGAFLSGLAACAILATSWTAGDLALRVFRISTIQTPCGALTSVRIALGLGLLGTLTLILGAFSSISLLPIVALALSVNLTWATLNWSHLKRSFGPIRFTGLATSSLTWFETLLLALSAAFFVFASLATLTPATILTSSDAVRQHLPLAREIWQNQSVLVFPFVDPDSAALLGPSLNAVAFGLGGFTAIGILQALVSVSCLVAIAGLGSTLAGRLAGIAGAAFFSATPLVLWLSGHAYPDLLAVLFACAAARCAISWQVHGTRSWLTMAGMLAGFSLATKQISAVVVLGIVIGLVIAARPGATILDRLQAGLVTSLACAIAFVPWFIRSVLLTGTFPLLDTLLRQLKIVPELGTITEALPVNVPSVAPVEQVVQVFSGGVSRTLPGIIAGPWDLTFQGAFTNWQVVRHGEFGILLLMFLPLVFFTLCSRGSLLLAISALITFVGWVFTIQVPRHLLPGLAFLAVLAGISVATLHNGQLELSRILSRRLAQVCAVIGIALTPLFFLPNTTTGFPISVVTGTTSPDDYVARVDPATTALRAASAKLPADTLVGYVGEWLGAQSSTEVWLFYLGTYTPDPNDSLDNLMGDSPEAIFKYFDGWGIQNLIWDRPETRPQDIDSTLLSGDFLLQYSTILNGDNGIYLFKLEPSGVPDPRTGRNLLQDPGFATLSESGNVWNGSKRDLSDSGTFQPRRQASVSQRVDVEPGQQYLIVLEGSCTSARDQTRVSLTWLDADGHVLSRTADDIPLGSTANSGLMWRVAPDHAASAEFGISTVSGTPCLVREIGMYTYVTA